MIRTRLLSLRRRPSDASNASGDRPNVSTLTPSPESHNADALRHLHAQSISLIQFEVNLIITRTNAMLTLNSAMLGVVTLVQAIAGIARARVPIAIICIIGLCLSLVHMLVIDRTRQALSFWRATACIVEAHDDFLSPELRSLDLDMTAARIRAWGRDRLPVQQTRLNVEWGRRPEPLRKVLSNLRIEPNSLYQFGLPLLFVTCWLIIAAWTLIQPSASPAPTRPAVTSPASPDAPSGGPSVTPAP